MGEVFCFLRMPEQELQYTRECITFNVLGSSVEFGLQKSQEMLFRARASMCDIFHEFQLSKRQIKSQNQFGKVSHDLFKFQSEAQLKCLLQFTEHTMSSLYNSRQCLLPRHQLKFIYRRISRIPDLLFSSLFRSACKIRMSVSQQTIRSTYFLC